MQVIKVNTYLHQINFPLVCPKYQVLPGPSCFNISFILEIIRQENVFLSFWCAVGRLLAHACTDSGNRHHNQDTEWLQHPGKLPLLSATPSFCHLPWLTFSLADLTTKNVHTPHLSSYHTNSRGLWNSLIMSIHRSGIQLFSHLFTHSCMYSTNIYRSNYCVIDTLGIGNTKTGQRSFLPWRGRER